MSENDKRKRMERMAVMVLDLLAFVISYMVSLYIRNGNFMWKNQEISCVSVFEYIILVYILVSFFRNTKKDFFERGYMKELIDVIKETSCVAAILIITMFLFKISADFSRIVIVLTYFSVIALEYVFRSAFKQYIRYKHKKELMSKMKLIGRRGIWTGDVLHEWLWFSYGVIYV